MKKDLAIKGKSSICNFFHRFEAYINRLRDILFLKWQPKGVIR